MMTYILSAACGWLFMMALSARKAERRAAAEREELHRWRIGWQESRQWLGEFPDALTALEHLNAYADGRQTDRIAELRERMRTRRTAAAGDRRARPRHVHAAGVTGTTTGAPL